MSGYREENHRHLDGVNAQKHLLTHAFLSQPLIKLTEENLAVRQGCQIKPAQKWINFLNFARKQIRHQHIQERVTLLPSLTVRQASKSLHFGNARQADRHVTRECKYIKHYQRAPVFSFSQRVLLSTTHTHLVALFDIASRCSRMQILQMLYTCISFQPNLNFHIQPPTRDSLPSDIVSLLHISRKRRVQCLGHSSRQIADTDDQAIAY